MRKVATFLVSEGFRKLTRGEEAVVGMQLLHSDKVGSKMPFEEVVHGKARNMKKGRRVKEKGQVGVRRVVREPCREPMLQVLRVEGKKHG
jgi:hypothetical protein